jgi:hypothetical protein
MLLLQQDRTQIYAMLTQGQARCQMGYQHGSAMLRQARLKPKHSKQLHLGQQQHQQKNNLLNNKNSRWTGAHCQFYQAESMKG